MGEELINFGPVEDKMQGIIRALKFTPGIKFINDEMLNEFVVTVERRDVGEIDVKNDRDSDRDDREDRDREDRDDVIEMQHISYKSLSGVQWRLHWI